MNKPDIIEKGNGPDICSKCGKKSFEYFGVTLRKNELYHVHECRCGHRLLIRVNQED